MKGPGRLASSSSQIKDCEFDNQKVAPIVGFLLTGNVYHVLPSSSAN